jgi:hypothetical protein
MYLKQKEENNFVVNTCSPKHNDCVKENEMGRACSTNGGEEECM